VQRDSREQHVLPQRPNPDQRRHGPFSDEGKPGGDPREPQRRPDRRYWKSLELVERENIVGSRSVEPIAPRQLKQDRVEIQDANLELQEPLCPGDDHRNPGGCDPAADAPPAVQRKCGARRGKHQEEGEIPQQVIARVEQVDVAMMQRHYAEPDDDRCPPAPKADQQGDSSHHGAAENRVDGQQRRREPGQGGQARRSQHRGCLGSGQNALFPVPNRHVG